MANAELRRAVKIAHEAAEEAGKDLRRHYGNATALSKGAGDSVGGVVTELDRRTELFLKERLATFSPGVGFRGEEFGVQKEAQRTWLVDPIDGTGNFVRGLPHCTVMIALIAGKSVMASVIHDIASGDTYSAIDGEGAYCNNTPINVSKKSLRQSYISFESRIEDEGNPNNNEKYMAVRRRAGMVATLNAGYEFAMVASGKFDGRISLDPYGEDWDYAPGSLLVREAGGVVANIGSKGYVYTNHDFMAVNRTVYEELTTGPDAIFPMQQ